MAHPEPESTIVRTRAFPLKELESASLLRWLGFSFPVAFYDWQELEGLGNKSGLKHLFYSSNDYKPGR